MRTSTTADLVVVGGGVIGLAVAWQAAEQGLQVVLADPRPGGGASHAAAGMLAPVSELHHGEEATLALGLAAAARYPSFVAQLQDASGLEVGYAECGTLAVALDAGDRHVLDDLGDLQVRMGLRVTAVDSTQARTLEPLLAPRITGGLLVEGDHQVDPRRLTSALLLAAERRGVTVVREQVVEVTVGGEAVTGVRLAGGGELTAQHTVLAAGARSGRVAGLPLHAQPPVRPVKGQVLRLSVPPGRRPFLRRTVRGTVHGNPVYLVPRSDGELVVGATQEELGDDEQVTAGGMYQLLRDGHALVPGIGELPLLEATARLRPGSPDNAPLVGPGGLDRLVLATGHHRQGVLLAPVTADAVTALLTRGALPELMAPFSPARFDCPASRHPHRPTERTPA